MTKSTLTDPMQPKITGMFTPTAQATKRTRQKKSKKQRNFGDKGEKKRKERDNAWSESEENDSEHDNDAMDIDDEEYEDNVDKEGKDTEENETSPLDGWLKENEEFGNLFNSSEEMEIGDETEEEIEKGEMSNGTKKTNKKTEIDLTNNNDDEIEETGETMNKEIEETGNTQENNRKDGQSKGTRNGMKATNRETTNGGKATRTNGTKGKKGTKKDGDEKDNTSTPKKRLGSEIVNYKKVNHKSNNRRVCRVKKGNEKVNDDDTPDKSNKSLYPHVEVTRVSLKLKIPAAQNKNEAVMQVLKEFFTQLKKIDKSIQIYTWKEDNEKSHGRIKETSEIGDMKTMQVHSSKLYVFNNQNEMTLYPQIRIGHDMALEDIREGIRDWGRTHDCNIFRNMLQCEQATEIGWLLYSTRTMDAGALADEITDTIGTNLGLRWKTISTGQKGKIPQNQKVFALIVEVDKMKKGSAQERLTREFGRKIRLTEDYPNGVRLRFIKTRKDAANIKEAAKHDRLKRRQKRFLESIETAETQDIVQLDYSPEEGEPTLRQMIMSIKSHEYPKTPLFHSVDMDWRGQGHVFNFSPKMEDEARCLINVMLPYLQHHYPLVDVSEYFTDDTAVRCEAYNICEKTGQVISTFGEDFDEEEEDEMIGFNLTIDKSNEKVSLTRPEKDKKTPMPEDDDSVSTFGGNRKELGRRGRTESTHSSTTTPSSKFVPQSIPRVHRKDGGDDVSIISSTSTVTMKTIETLEARMDARNQEINKRLDLVLEKLFSNQAGAATASGHQDGTPRPDIHENAEGDKRCSSGNGP